MSKSTNRYGQIKFCAHTTIDANPTPTKKMVANWERLDILALKEFGKKYEKLTGKERTTLHFNLNTGAYKETNVQTSQSATAPSVA